MSDIRALAWAKPGYTLFRYLAIGERFVFDHENQSPEAILIKTANNGYRHAIGGRQWATLARVLVYPVQP